MPCDPQKVVGVEDDPYAMLPTQGLGLGRQIRGDEHRDSVTIMSLDGVA